MSSSSLAITTTSIAPSLIQARAAYDDCLLGLTHRGVRQLEALRQQEQDKVVRSELQLFAALGVRLMGVPEASLARLLVAAEDVPPTRSELTGVIELLLLETQISVGKLEPAKARLVELAPKLPKELVDLLNGVVHWARGEYTEGLSLFEASVSKLTGAAQRWARAMYADALLDAGRHDAVLAETKGLLAAEIFDEVTMRAAATAALCHAIRQDGTGLDEALDTARTLTQNVARYRAWVDLAEALAAARQNVQAGLRHAERGTKLLGASDFRFDEGRLLILLAEALSTRNQASLVPWSSRGRELLSRMGLVGRLERMSRVEGGGAGGSVMMSAAKSLQRSMVGVGAGDDLELGAIFEVNRQIASSLQIEQVLQRLLESVIAVLKAERGVILRGTGADAVCIAAKGLDPARVKPGAQEVSFSVIQEAERQGTAVLADNAQLDARFRGQASVMASDVRSVICAPLKTAKGTWGTLYVDTRVASRLFRDHHRELLGVFCTQAAGALENASTYQQLDDLNRTLESKVQARTAELSQANDELQRSLHELKTTQLALAESQRDALDREMKVARDIQLALVPSLEAVQRPGIRVAGVLEPASYCGGDLWCVPPLPGERTLVFVGDVTGHGVGSALIASAVKAVIDTYVRVNVEVDLAKLMGAISDAIFDSRNSKLAMTGVSVLYDHATKKLSFCSAGHPFPMMLSGAVGLPKLSMLTQQAPRMGERSGQTYEVAERQLSGGERVVLYTDGLSEGVNPKGRQWGAKAMSNAVVAGAANDVSALRDSIMTDARTYFSGVVPNDDVTLVVLEIARE